VTLENPPAPPEPSAAPQKSRLRARLWLAIRMLVPIGVFAYLLTIVPLRDLGSALARVSPLAVLTTIVAVLTALAVGALRWRLLFTACGIAARPRVRDLFRLHMVGYFYNSYLPGGVGGDVVRGVATQGLMGERGLPGALAIVLLERTLGLSGLLILVAVSFSFFPLPGVENVVYFSALGLLATAGVVASIVAGSRLAPYLPKPIGRLMAQLPTIRSAPAFALALLLSVVTQATGVVIAGHALAASIAGGVAFTTSLGVLPLIGAAQYFPLTVGGAGVREAGFVLFYGLVGVSRADALATSLAYAGVQYAVAGVGGILHALLPLAARNVDEA
jgi:glycosyltransferase 2 family protein